MAISCWLLAIGIDLDKILDYVAYTYCLLPSTYSRIINSPSDIHEYCISLQRLFENLNYL